MKTVEFNNMDGKTIKLITEEDFNSSAAIDNTVEIDGIRYQCELYWSNFKPEQLKTDEYYYELTEKVGAKGHEIACYKAYYKRFLSGKKVPEKYVKDFQKFKEVGVDVRRLYYAVDYSPAALIAATEKMRNTDAYFPDNIFSDFENSGFDKGINLFIERYDVENPYAPYKTVGEVWNYLLKSGDGWYKPEYPRSCGKQLKDMGLDPDTPCNFWTETETVSGHPIDRIYTVYCVAIDGGEVLRFRAVH